MPTHPFAQLLVLDLEAICITQKIAYVDVLLIFDRLTPRYNSLDLCSLQGSSYVMASAAAADLFYFDRPSHQPKTTTETSTRTGWPGCCRGVKFHS